MKYGFLKDDEYYYKSFRDAMWLKIFDHNLNGSNHFADEDEALSCKKPYKYSILKEIETIGDDAKYDGKYEFLIEYPEEQGNFNWWRQTNFPTKENESVKKSKVEGYEKVDVSWDNHSWGGLAKTIHKITLEDNVNCIPSLLDGSVSTNSWFYAIGKYKCSVTYVNTYPSYDPGYSQVVLWLRVKPCIQVSFICERKIHLHLLYIFIIIKSQ